MHVLFCESNKKYGGFFLGLLKQKQYEVVAVGGGQDALDKLDAVPQGTFHVVVINNESLQLEGIDVLRFIRQWKGFETLPVFIFSTDDSIRALVAELSGIFFARTEIDQLFEALDSIEKGISMT
jgi:DNA-binding response OmpR family regulator